MPDTIPEAETNPAQSIQETIQPVTPIGQKLKDYQRERVQVQADQQLDKIAKKKEPLYNTSRSKSIMDQLSNPDIGAMQDPFKQFQPHAYSPGWETGKFERYYTHSLYKKLGYSPYRDNEKIYNEASTGWQDFRRMSHQWGGLAGLGALDMYQEMFSMNTFKEDITNANKMEKAMAIGSSTRPGFGSSLTNFAMNTAYTAGIIGEMGAEQLILAGATAAAGGLDAAATIPLMGTRLARGANKIKDLITTTRSFNDAKRLFETSNLARTGSKIGKEAIDFLNPFEHTTKLLRGESKIGKAGRTFSDVSDFVKAKATAGALWGDIAAIRAVLSESKLEGGSVYKNTKKILIDDFYKKHGRAPKTEEEAKDIETRSHGAARSDMLGNIPMIFASNKIVLETALGGISSLDKLMATGREITGKIIEKPGALLGQDLYERVGKYSMKGIRDAIKPTNLAKNGFKYTLANFTEGFQELGQEALAIANVDYYTNANNDPAIIGSKAYLASLAKGVQSQMSGQGLETFASGFFMGSVLQGPQQLVFNAMPRALNKIASSTKYAAYVKAKEDFTNNLVNAMNETGKSSLMTIKALDRNFLAQKNGRAILEKAIENADEKIKHDSKEEMTFNHIYTLLEGGKEYILKTQLNQLKEMDDNSLAEALGLNHLSIEEKKDIKSRLTGFENKINVLKDKFEYYDKNFNNPFQEGSHPHQALSFAKKTAIFARYDFDNTLERLHNITNNFSSSKPLKKASYSDFALLFEADKMNLELSTLKAEIEIYEEGTDGEAKKTHVQKVKKLGHLRKLKEAIVEYGDHITKSSVIKDNLKTEVSSSKEQTKATDNLYKAYSEYVHYLAKEKDEHVLNDNIASSFKGIKDFYAIREDNAHAARAINTLADPKFLSGYVERAVALSKIRSEREIQDRRNALAEFIRAKENNDLLNAFYEIGVFINTKDAEALIEKGTVPVEVYDVTSLELIPSGSEKDIQVQSLLVDFKIITTPTPEVTSPIENTPITTTLNKITIRTPWEEVPHEIKLSLVTEFKKWNALRNEEEQFSIGEKTDEQLISTPTIRDFWLHYAEAREPILKNYNEKTGRTQVGPIITKEGVPVIIPGGAIYYVSPGTGKSTLAEGSAIYVDGDKVLYDVMKLKGLNPSTPQNAGIELYKNYKAFIDIVEKDARAKALSLKNQGRIVLTSNRFAYEIVDKAYLSTDKKRMADEFQKREPGLSREEAERQASSKIKNETEALQDKEIIDIPQGKFIEDLIVKDLPKLEPEDLTQVKTNDNLQTWNLGEHADQIEDNILMNLAKTDAEIPGGEVFSEFRDRVLNEFIKIVDTSSTGTLLVVDPIMLRLINTWDNSGRPSDFSKLDTEKFADDKLNSDEFKEFKFNDKLIWVMRHGDISDSSLAQTGIKQARDIAKKLAKENITDIISTLFPGAYNTALIIEEEINKPEIQEPVIEEFPIETFQARFDKVNTLEELDNLASILAIETTELFLSLNTVYPDNLIEDMIKNKRREIILKVDKDNIFKGDHLVMKDKTLYGEKGLILVVGKGPKAIQVRKFSEPHGTTRFIKFEDLVNEVEYKVSKDIQDTDIVPKITPEGEILAKENLKLQTKESENLQDQKAELDKLKQSKKSGEQADSDLTEGANCPT